MILAEMEIFHSRPVAPTRRVALGHLDLPIDPAPGFGGLLLGGVVAAHMPALDPDLFDELHRLTVHLEHGQRVSQPRLRHRLQTDRVGLLRSRHQLLGDGEELTFELDDKGSAAQHVLAAVYATALLPLGPRVAVMAMIRKAMRWGGGLDNSLVAYLAGLSHKQTWSEEAQRDPRRWALGVLGFTARNDRAPGRRTIQRRFRELLRDAHPDHGGETTAAALRIAELAEARRILLMAS